MKSLKLMIYLDKIFYQISNDNRDKRSFVLIRPVIRSLRKLLYVCVQKIVYLRVEGVDHDFIKR